MVTSRQYSWPGNHLAKIYVFKCLKRYVLMILGIYYQRDIEMFFLKLFHAILEMAHKMGPFFL